MAVFSSAGIKISIGPTVDPAVTNTTGEFAALSYTEVGEVESIGEFGDTSNTITFTPLSAARVNKLKGSRNAGGFTITMGRDTGDAGQVALRAAEKTKFDYAVKIEYSDASSGSPSQNSIQYFPAKVMSFTDNISGVDDITRASAQIEITGEPLTIVAV